MPGMPGYLAFMGTADRREPARIFPGGEQVTTWQLVDLIVLDVVTGLMLLGTLPWRRNG